MRQRGGDLGHHECDLAADQALHALARALVGHVHEPRAGRLLDDLHREIAGAARSRRAVGERAGVALAERHQRGQRLHRNRGMAAPDVGAQHAARHGREVALSVVRQVPLEAGIDHERRSGGEEQRIAVGRGFRNDLGADHAACSGPVVHHEALLERIHERRSQQPRKTVAAPARRGGNDQPDGTRGPGRVLVLRRSGAGGERKDEGRNDPAAVPACRASRRDHHAQPEVSRLLFTAWCSRRIATWGRTRSRTRSRNPRYP